MKLQEGEEILHQLRPDKNILWIWFFVNVLPIGLFGGAAAFGLLAVLKFSFGSGKAPDFSLMEVIEYGISFVIVFMLLALVYYESLRRTYIYYITNQRCVFHGGIIKRIERSVHYHKITDVEMSQNIIERILGISKLNIFTPGTSSRSGTSSFQKAEISFIGLKNNERPAGTINGILKKFRATGE